MQGQADAAGFRTQDCGGEQHERELGGEPRRAQHPQRCVACNSLKTQIAVIGVRLERALVNGGLEVSYAERRFQPPLRSILELGPSRVARAAYREWGVRSGMEVIVFG